LNIGKRGISTTVGIPGVHLNFGKRGIRPTVGLPGTGLSFTPSQNGGTSNKAKNNLAVNMIAWVISGVTVCIISLCCVGVILFNIGNPPIPTPIPQKAIPIEQIIAMTANAAKMQTQVFYSPTLPVTPMATSTFTPTVTMLPIDNAPTATLFIFMLQTDVAQPTQYIYSTNTPLSLETQVIQPTQQSPGGNCDASYPNVCINGNPRLNCTQLRAKGIFHFRVLPDDPLGYDKDNDGIGCE